MNILVCVLKYREPFLNYRSTFLLIFSTKKTEHIVVYIVPSMVVIHIFYLFNPLRRNVSKVFCIVSDFLMMFFFGLLKNIYISLTTQIVQKMVKFKICKILTVYILIKCQVMLTITILCTRMTTKQN